MALPRSSLLQLVERGVQKKNSGTKKIRSVRFFLHFAIFSVSQDFIRKSQTQSCLNSKYTLPSSMEDLLGMGADSMPSEARQSVSGFITFVCTKSDLESIQPINISFKNCKYILPH